VTAATSSRIINRHMARLLTNLEQAECPRLFLDAIKNELGWLRADLQAAEQEQLDPGPEA